MTHFIFLSGDAYPLRSDLGDRRFWAVPLKPCLPHLVKRDGRWRIDNIEDWEGHNRTDFERALSWVRRQNFETSK